MEWILNAAQMREADRATIEKMGVPSLTLMERAALKVTEELVNFFDTRRILFACGSGNNGGDGIAAARILHARGYHAVIWLVGREESLTAEAKKEMEIAANYGVPTVKNCRPEEYTTIVDALFGIGLSRDVEGRYLEAVQSINASRVPVLAVDIPSGVDASTGRILGAAVRAEATVTFAYGKAGLYLYPGANQAGRVLVRDVGIYADCREALRSAGRKELSWLPARPADGNKGTFGKVLVAAGSLNMCGAAYFAAKAALYGGAGMVRIFTLECNRTILQQLIPEAVLETFAPGDAVEERLCVAENWADAVVCGPGIGTGPDAWRMVSFFLKEETKKPLILDADGLNLLAAHPERMDGIRRPCILTPHMGEMSRLCGRTIMELKDNPMEALAALRAQTAAVLVMKDARTLVDTGDEIWLNRSGNDGMATAGSGDALAGLIGSLCAQGMPAGQAAVLGVYLHGLAGDEERRLTGARPMTAQDILDGIRRVMKDLP